VQLLLVLRFWLSGGLTYKSFACTFLQAIMPHAAPSKQDDIREAVEAKHETKHEAKHEAKQTHTRRLSNCHQELDTRRLSLGSLERPLDAVFPTPPLPSPPPVSVTVPHHAEAKRQHARSLSSAHEELIQAKADSKDGSDDDLITLDDLPDMPDIASFLGPEGALSLSTRVRGLSVGLQPGSTVLLKRNSARGRIMQTSVYQGTVRYLLKLESGEEETVSAKDLDIAEPPLGWLCTWPNPDASPDSPDEALLRGVVVGASWFREQKRVEVDVKGVGDVWKDFADVTFREPIVGAKVACKDGTRVVPGVVEGTKEFRGSRSFQVKFDEGYGGEEVSGWFTTTEMIVPNEFHLQW